MKRLLTLVIVVLGTVTLTSSTLKKAKPPEGCGYDSNGVKVCCAQSGMGGICWREDWKPVN